MLLGSPTMLWPYPDSTAMLPVSSPKFTSLTVLCCVAASLRLGLSMFRTEHPSLHSSSLCGTCKESIPASRDLTSHATQNSDWILTSIYLNFKEIN